MYTEVYTVLHIATEFIVYTSCLKDMPFLYSWTPSHILTLRCFHNKSCGWFMCDILSLCILDTEKVAYACMVHFRPTKEVHGNFRIMPRCAIQLCALLIKKQRGATPSKRAL